MRAPRSLDWPHYGKDLANTRYLHVNQINPHNVGDLQVAWVFHTGVLDPLAELQSSPIEVDGRLFITDGHDNVFALNAATGTLLWKVDGFSDETLLGQFFLCCGRNNKGAAYGDDKVYVGRFDDSVVAMNAKTGAVVWRTTVADWHDKVTINSAAQFAETGDRGLVIVSLSGGEFEVRGQIFALDSKTGNIVWHFSTTVPNSYAGTSFKSGGGAVWNPPATDPELGLVFLSVGNASPDILGENRAGDNLYATSILALNLSSGNPVWHFQEVHHDIWDYDSAQPAVLFPLEKNGKEYDALGHCDKNGQYYILDRRTGEPIYPVTEKPVPTGAAFPGDNGGCEWNPAAFSPRTHFVYYGATSLMCSRRTRGIRACDKRADQWRSAPGIDFLESRSRGKTVWHLRRNGCSNGQSYLEDSNSGAREVRGACGGRPGVLRRG